MSSQICPAPRLCANHPSCRHGFRSNVCVVGVTRSGGGRVHRWTKSADEAHTHSPSTSAIVVTLLYTSHLIACSRALAFLCSTQNTRTVTSRFICYLPASSCHYPASTSHPKRAKTTKRRRTIQTTTMMTTTHPLTQPPHQLPIALPAPLPALHLRPLSHSQPRRPPMPCSHRQASSRKRSGV